MEDGVRHRVPLEFHPLEQLLALRVRYLALAQGQPKRVPVVLLGEHSLDVLPLEVLAAAGRPDRPVCETVALPTFPRFDRQDLVENVEAICLLDFLRPADELGHGLIRCVR